MSERMMALVACAALACPISPTLAQTDDRKKDDKATFSAPPTGFDTRRDGIDRGKLETVEYDSTTVGVKRQARVYTPPGYTKDQKYPVFYLLHGIGGDEKKRARGGAPHAVLGNLYADKKVVPLNVVMPHGQAAKKLRLLYVACGDKDGLARISEGVHKMLDEKKVPHLYRVIPGGAHDFKVWKSDLYHFAQLIFRDQEPEKKAPDKKPEEPKPE